MHPQTCDRTSPAECPHQTTIKKGKGALVDRGANGGMCGRDARVFHECPIRHVDVRGLEDPEVTDMPVVSAGAVATVFCQQARFAPRLIPTSFMSSLQIFHAAYEEKAKGNLSSHLC